MKTTVSEKGQITIPKRLRDRLGLDPGTVLEFVAEKGALIGRKRPQADPLTAWRGKGKLPTGKTTHDYLKQIQGPMITALDSSVALDVLLDDPAHADRSQAAMAQARNEGRIIVCSTVITELHPVVGGALPDLLHDWQIQHLPDSLESALLAGEWFTRYLRSGGKRGRVVADFMIGAHAKLHADRLLTRDDGFQRTHFRGLELWQP